MFYLIDRALQRRATENRPIRVGVAGLGAMAKGLIHQIAYHTPGMVVSVVYNRSLDKAQATLLELGVAYQTVESPAALAQAQAAGVLALTHDPRLLTGHPDLDIVVEMTGTIGFAAQTMLDAIAQGHHVLSFNPEVDATLGPLLKHRADQAGVLYGVAEGDQPGVVLNLFRMVKGMGFEPLVLGNIKGMQDHYRTPATQAAFAAKWHQTPQMVTSFADGSKISFEQACIAHATGFGVARRGMWGHASDQHVDDLTHLFDVDDLRARGGIVDYILGGKPSPGVFVYAATTHPLHQHYLRYGKLGEGPLYSFYTPYHLLFFELPNSIVRMVDHADPVMAPLGAPVVGVLTTAKRDLQAGEILDEIGGYMTYGVCDNFAVCRRERLLPMGLAEGCRLRRPIGRDQPIGFDDIEPPQESLVFRLYAEQMALFAADVAVPTYQR